jgi:CxxC motif-containing protein (DUF1111 family)
MDEEPFEKEHFVMRNLNLTMIRRTGLVLLVLLAVAAFLFSFGGQQIGSVHAQGTLGSPISGLTSGQLSAFNVGFQQFNVEWDPVKGLGPVYTNQNCALCHAYPVAGGTADPNMQIPQRTTFFGKLNSDGSFNPLTEEGGFVLQPLTASSFIRGCTVRGETLPADATVMSQRVPQDLYGLGFIDNIPDVTITSFATDKGMGIHGATNMVADWNNAIHVGKFGTKAQFASLVQAASTAFLHDIGVTNPVILNEDCPNAAPGTPACPTSQVPTICIRKAEPNDLNGKESIQIYDYLVYLAPNMPGTANANGKALFTSVGCALCHNPTYTTKSSVTVLTNFTGGKTPVIPSLSKQPANLYSDLLIHHMGPGLADCMQFGQANGDQWRTTPLWGLSTRPLYLHDGRASDLMSAIEDHKSIAGVATACTNSYVDSEANTVIDNFNALTSQDQGDLMTFINSL